MNDVIVCTNCNGTGYEEDFLFKESVCSVCGGSGSHSRQESKEEVSRRWDEYQTCGDPNCCSIHKTIDGKRCSHIREDSN